MSFTFSPPAVRSHPDAALPRDPAAGLVWADPAHRERASLEAFIAGEFRRAYGASVRHFCHTLVGRRDPCGCWSAALGFTCAAGRPLFLEQYLDEPVDLALASRTGKPVRRADVVEVGNLAACSTGAARELIGFMTHHLHGLGLTWVTFTATRALLNSFARLRLRPGELGDADPARLPGGARDWGSYYTTSPKVMFGNIGIGHAELERQSRG